MIKNLSESLTYAIFSSVTIVSMLMMAFFVAEPAISHGQDATSNDFYIRQTITDENSFKVVSDVNMVGSINGVTGGQATGTTDFVVLSNNSAGYSVDIDFQYTTNNEAMVGDESGSEAIRDYDGDVGGEPSFNFVASSSAAMFAYTVTSDDSADTAQSFLSFGGACNVASGSGGTQATDQCWKSPAAAGFTVVDAADAATTGATSTLKFVVTVPNGANPTPLAETYTATATLSLFTK
jgi:hypothetical protein